MSIDDIKREVAEGWPDIPAGEVALRIIDYMARLNDQELRMLTIPTLLQVAEREQVDGEFLAALAILVSSKVHVLDAKAFLWEGEEPGIPIDAQDLAEARQLGSLEHPETGALVEDFEGRIIPYFESSARFLDARTHG